MKRLRQAPARCNAAFFDLPPGSAAVLRQIPGYEDFDERYECLMSFKHGTGTKGAPIAFSLKLASVTQGPKCRTNSETYDGELELRIDDNALTAIATKHVDDIKCIDSHCNKACR